MDELLPMMAVTYGLVQAPSRPYENIWAVAECYWTTPTDDDELHERSSVAHRQFLGMSLCLQIDPENVAEAALGVERLNRLHAEEMVRPALYNDDRDRFTANGTLSGQTVVIDRATGSEILEWQTGDYALSSAFARLANRLVRLAAQLRVKT